MKTSDKPFISVVIPTYNRAGLIKKAINSVLAQTYQDFEIIVIDDGSKDCTVETVASFCDERIKLIQHSKNSGAPAARNTGIKAARGEWIAFLDSDDIWMTDKLEKQAAVIPGLPDVYGIIHCGIQNFDFKTRSFISERIARVNINKNIKSNLGLAPSTSAILVKKAALLDVGLFNEKLPAMQESELGLRLAQKYKFKLVDEFLVQCLRNHQQIMGNPSLYIKAKEIILETHNGILSQKLIRKYCNIIAGNSILHKDYAKAKEYLKRTLKNGFKVKTIILILLINTIPALSAFLLNKKYSKKGWIK